MKIAIPTTRGRLCTHFGHCDEFVLVEADVASKQILDTTHLPAPPHQPGLLPQWLCERGAETIIAGGMGQRAQQLFAQNGVKVIIGAPSADPGTLVSAYMDNTLETGENPCDH